MGPPSNLSPAALSVWGKSRRDDDAFLSLWQHHADASSVAGRLWDEWVPSSIRQRIAAPLPGQEEDARALLRWLAGSHDVGKATPAFAMQVESLADRMHAAGLTWSDDVRADRKYAPHATAGQFIIEDWLAEVHGWPLEQSQAWSVIVGGHHGVPPSRNALLELRERPHLLGWTGAGAPVWRRVQREFLDWMTVHTGAAERFAQWRRVLLPQPVQVLLTGIVIIADWIASNDRLFPYGAGTQDGGERAAWAWDALDLPSPWRPPVESASIEDLITSRFNLPAGASPHPVQEAAISLARDMPAPGMLVIEAPMGDGKTEAALAAVEVLAARFDLNGCFIALPTRATSDAMLPRFVPWVQRLPDRDVDRGAFDLALAHGKARWNSVYQDLLKGRVSSIGDLDEAQDVAAHYWLTGRKKSLLSTFVVGTIDQLLMASLQVKHVVLRHLGLAGKVVVIDEAHAYDVYMSRYLDRALAWLGAYGIPVIVLSATLPAARREEMVRAYDGGAVPAVEQRVRRGQPSAATATEHLGLRDDIGYPSLVASRPGRAPVIVNAKASGRSVDVHIEQLADDTAELADRLRAELADGGCALVVRNTVRRVFATADALRTLLPDIPVVVAHSRYMAPDRADKDAWLRETFGPPEKEPERPDCMIVVASQVAEQSLDIDFDQLVTDLAPIDLMLQRMGRLHRHERPRPRQLATARCLIAGADWSAQPPTPASGSTSIYTKFPLLRAAAVLNDHGSKPIRLPDDIAGLVQGAYGGRRVGPVGWQTAIDDAKTAFDRLMLGKRRDADVFRLPEPGAPGLPVLDWFREAIDDTETRGESTALAQVRDSPASVEVIMLVERGGQLYTPGWLSENGDQHVPTESLPEASVAKSAAGCTITLPPEVDVDAAIAELERRHRYPAWQQKSREARSHWLCGVLVLNVDDDGRGQVAGWKLRYDRADGLRIVGQPSR